MSKPTWVDAVVRCDCGDSANLLDLLAHDQVCLDNNCLGDCDRWHFV